MWFKFYLNDFYNKFVICVYLLLKLGWLNIEHTEIYNEIENIKILNYKINNI